MNKNEIIRDTFSKHIATYTEAGPIKIVDFKKPDTSIYRIRFLFEEDCCRLHISGDLGELTACNYNNMTFEKFENDFTNDAGYFESKVLCHSRPLYVYDEEIAAEQLKEFIGAYELEDSIKDHYDDIDDFIELVLSEDFSDSKGIGDYGYGILSEVLDNLGDYYSELTEIGKCSTDIIDYYLTAYKMAMEYLRQNKKKSRIVSVEWDNGDENDADNISLPVRVEIPNDIAKDDIADWLSDNYGFCVKSFSIEED